MFSIWFTSYMGERSYVCAKDFKTKELACEALDRVMREATNGIYWIKAEEGKYYNIHFANLTVREDKK